MEAGRLCWWRKGRRKEDRDVKEGEGVRCRGGSGNRGGMLDRLYGVIGLGYQSVNTGKLSFVADSEEKYCQV